MSEWLRGVLCSRLEEYVLTYAREHVRPALNGEPKATRYLYASLSEGERAVLAVAMWKARVPLPAFRVFLASTWDHEHRGLIAAAKTRRRMAAMFRYAAFALPDHLPESVQVWRGTSKLTFAKARKGYAWTVNRDVACWFAMRFSKQNGQPLVISTVIHRSQIALFHDERAEREVVLMKPPKNAKVDGDPADWQEGFERQKAVMAEEEKRLGESIRARLANRQTSQSR